MSFFSHIADVAGGLLGRVTGTKAANEYSQYANENALQIRVNDGLKAGINPLAAIGASANYTPTMQTNSATDLVNLGSGALNGMKGLTGLFKEKAKDDVEYEREAQQLDLESKRLENRILKNKAEESSLNLSQGSGKEVPAEKPTRMGERALFVPAYDLKGRPRLVANQDVIEGDNDNAGYRAAILTAIANGDIDKKTGEIKNPETRKMLDDMYYDMTGHHIKNLEQLYVSPTEMGLVTKDEARDIWQVLHNWFGNKDKGY